jgi:hypothetical protein
LLGFAVRHRGEHPKLGPAGRFLRVGHHRNGSATQHRRVQDEARNTDLDRFRAPSGDGRVGRDDEETCRAAVDSARDRRIGGPTEALSRVDRQLSFDDDHPDGDVTGEKHDNDVGAVFGRLDLGQVGRGEARFGVRWKRGAQHLDQDLGGERRTVLEEIDEDLMGHRGHGGGLPP